MLSPAALAAEPSARGSSPTLETEGTPFRPLSAAFRRQDGGGGLLRASPLVGPTSCEAALRVVRDAYSRSLPNQTLRLRAPAPCRFPARHRSFRRGRRCALWAARRISGDRGGSRHLAVASAGRQFRRRERCWLVTSSATVPLAHLSPAAAPFPHLAGPSVVGQGCVRPRFVKSATFVQPDVPSIDEGLFAFSARLLSRP